MFKKCFDSLLVRKINLSNNDKSTHQKTVCFSSLNLNLISKLYFHTVLLVPRRSKTVWCLQCAVNIVLSSRHRICWINYSDPRTKPCGTPYQMSPFVDKFHPTFTFGDHKHFCTRIFQKHV